MDLRRAISLIPKAETCLVMWTKGWVVGGAWQAIAAMNAVMTIIYNIFFIFVNFRFFENSDFFNF
jgi:hypothetical protein